MNPHKGEVTFNAGEATYTLRFSIDAICALEEKLGRGILDIVAEMQSWAPPPAGETAAQAKARIGRLRMGLVRAMFWAALRDHHPKIDMRQAGELIVPAGGMNEVVGLIGQALVLAFPAAEGEASSQDPI